MKKLIPLATVLKSIKYLHTDFPKETVDLCVENHSVTERNWRWHEPAESIRVHGLQGFVLLRSVLPKAIHRFVAIPGMVPAMWGFFRNTKIYPKIHMESQGTPNSQNSIEKEAQSWKTPISQSQNLLQSYGNQNSVVLA